MRWSAFLFAVTAFLCVVVSSCPSEYLLSVSGYAGNITNESKITEHFEELFDLCGQDNIAVYFDNETFGIGTYCIDNPNSTLQATFHSLLLQNVTFSNYACNGRLRGVLINESLLCFTIKCEDSDLNMEVKEIDKNKEVKFAHQRYRRFRHHHHHHGFHRHHHHHGFHRHHHHFHPFRHYGFYPHMYIYPFPYYPFYPYYAYPGIRAYPIIYDDPIPGNYSGRFIRGNSIVILVVSICVVVFLLLCCLGFCILSCIHHKMHVHEMHDVHEVYMLPSPSIGMPYEPLAPNYVINDGQQGNLGATTAQINNTPQGQ